VEVDLQGGNVRVGESVPVRATVHLGTLAPENVRVQAYYGEEANAQILSPTSVDLELAAPIDGGSYLYKGTVTAFDSGSYALSVRIIPTHPNLIQAHELRLISWAK
jgi:starch phosphorylase